MLAIGGITFENVRECFTAGSKGVAAIRLFNDAESLSEVVNAIRAAEKGIHGQTDRP